MGWFSKIEQPLVRSASIAIWKFFGDLDLRDAEKTQLHQHARLLYPRAEGRRAPGGPSDADVHVQPGGRHRRRQRPIARARGRSRPRAFHTPCRTC